MFSLSLPARGTKAFTMLELIVVIVILGVLAAIAIPTFRSVISKSQVASATETLKALDRNAKALAAFDDVPVNASHYDAAAGELSVALAAGTSAAGVYGTGTIAQKNVRFGVKVEGGVIGVAMVAANDACVMLHSASGTVTTFARGSLGSNCSGDTAHKGSTAADPGFSTGLASAPTAVTASAGDALATVSWTTPSGNGGYAITDYKVTASPAPATGLATRLVGSAATSFIFTGLTNGTSYTFTVVAVNAAGDSPASSASSAVTPAGAPGAPTIGTATAGTLSATVAYTAPPSNGGSAITSYRVYANGSTTPATLSGSATANPLTVTGLTAGTSYTFKVTAVNVHGESTLSAASNSVTPAAPDPVTTSFAYTGAVQQFTVPAGVTSVTVDLYGAQGGVSSGTGGGGGRVQGSVTVTPGETLSIYVGGQGVRAENQASGGWNGGGGTGDAYNGGSPGSGGGATDVRRGGTALANRVAVAAGGGGEGGANGGTGGGLTGTDGVASYLSSTSGGKGGTQSAGGAAGGGSNQAGTAGVLGVGGKGAGSSDVGGGGGGGGGFYGGGGGGTDGYFDGSTVTYASGGGAGGSSLVPPGGSTTSGGRTGHGVATITYVPTS